jgi:hypothetical protein
VRSSAAPALHLASPGEVGASATRRPGVAWIDLRKPNQPRDPGSPRCARRPGKQTWGQSTFLRLHLPEARSSRAAALPASHLRPRAKPARQRWRRPGAAWDRLSANQANHAIRIAVVRATSGKAGLGWDEPVRSRIAHCSQPASPGEDGAAATAKTRGRLGSMFANQFDHAIPDRRAPHVVRESKCRVS